MRFLNQPQLREAVRREVLQDVASTARNYSCAKSADKIPPATH